MLAPSRQAALGWNCGGAVGCDLRTAVALDARSRHSLRKSMQSVTCLSCEQADHFLKLLHVDQTHCVQDSGCWEVACRK
jgi:TPP-dependent indolepyruvate ferredoxin oxidoreductase alpha subunit